MYQFSDKTFSFFVHMVHKFESRIFAKNYDLVLRFKSDAKIYRNWTQNYDLVLRFKSDAKIYRNWTQIKAIY